MRIKITLTLLAISLFSLLSCGNDDDSKESIEAILIEKESLLTAQEKVRDLLILVKIDYAQLACIFDCSPSTVKRLKNGDTYATAKAEEDINGHYNYFITRGHGLENFKADCVTYKWYNNVISFMSNWWFWIVLIVICVLLGMANPEDPGWAIFLFILTIVFYFVVWIINLFGGQPDYRDVPDDFINNIDTLWETKVPKLNEITFEEAYYIMEAHKQFELTNNKDFYSTLLEASNNYYSTVTNDFLEKEYSISGSFNEIGILSSKTDKERFEIWEHKLNSYYSSLSYSRFIKTKTDNFSNNLNLQRKKDLEDVLNYIKGDSLMLNNVVVDVFKASEEAIIQSIAKANESIRENLEDIAITAVEVGALAVTGGSVAPVVRALDMGATGRIAYNFVMPKKDETKVILEKEYIDFIERNNIDFTGILDQNTNAYYMKLKQLIEARRDEKIHY